MKKQILKKENILLGLPSVSQEKAMLKAGELLVQTGYVDAAYIDAMFEREKIVSTYIGNAVAIPHGVGEAKDLINHSGIVVLQYPKGISYNGNTCYLVIGIAGKGNEHIKILSNIADALSDDDSAEALSKTDDINFVFDTFTSEDES